MRAVANSSVLISLSTIGRLNLLKEKFPQGILVPKAVWDEVVIEGKGQPGAKEVTLAKWINVQEVTDRALVSLLSGEMDAGEAEAITLCREKGIDVVLLDEKDARHAAQRLGLKILGTVGILIWAKRVGIISDLKEQLDNLQTKGKFHLARKVYEKALHAVGELP